MSIKWTKKNSFFFRRKCFMLCAGNDGWWTMKVEFAAQKTFRDFSLPPPSRTSLFLHGRGWKRKHMLMMGPRCAPSIIESLPSCVSCPRGAGAAVNRNNSRGRPQCHRVASLSLSRRPPPPPLPLYSAAPHLSSPAAWCTLLSPGRPQQ